MKLVKALRDYSIHYSLPIKSTSMKFSPLDRTTSFNFFIEKNDLLRNKENKKNTNIIKDYPKERIIVNKLVERIHGDIERMGIMLLEEFAEEISKEVKGIFNKYINYYKSEEGKQYFPNAFVESEYTNNSYVTLKYLGMDRHLLEAIVSVMNNN